MPDRRKPPHFQQLPPPREHIEKGRRSVTWNILLLGMGGLAGGALLAGAGELLAQGFEDRVSSCSNCQQPNKVATTIPSPTTLQIYPRSYHGAAYQPLPVVSYMQHHFIAPTGSKLPNGVLPVARGSTLVLSVSGGEQVGNLRGDVVALLGAMAAGKYFDYGNHTGQLLEIYFDKEPTNPEFKCNEPLYGFESGPSGLTYGAFLFGPNQYTPSIRDTLLTDPDAKLGKNPYAREILPASSIQ